MCGIKASKYRGVNLPISTGAGVEYTTYTPPKSDGDIIAISASSNYDSEDQGKILITLRQGDNEPLSECPLNLLQPDGSSKAIELMRKMDNGTINITVKSQTANSNANNPITLVFLHAKTSC